MICIFTIICYFLPYNNLYYTPLCLKLSIYDIHIISIILAYKNTQCIIIITYHHPHNNPFVMQPQKKQSQSSTTTTQPSSSLASSYQPSSAFDYTMKVIIIGDSGIGKSSLLLRYHSNKFVNNYLMTIGINTVWNIQEIDDIRIKLQIWDTAGQ